MAVSYSVGPHLAYDSFADLPNPGSSGSWYWTPDTQTFWTWNGAAYVSAHSSPAAPRVMSILSSATPTINVATTDFFEVTALAVAITGFVIAGTPLDGQTLNVRLLDNGTGRAVTWGTSFLASGAVALLTTTVAGKTHLNGFIYDANKSKFVATYKDATGY